MKKILIGILVTIAVSALYIYIKWSATVDEFLNNL